jgi:hypothetical protein
MTTVQGDISQGDKIPESRDTPTLLYCQKAAIWLSQYSGYSTVHFMIALP